MEDKLYQEGFNAGFVLQTTTPELAELLALVKSDDPYLNGVRDGKAEKEEEKLRELNQLREQGKNDIERSL